MALKKKKTSIYDLLTEDSLNDKVIIEGELVYASLLKKRVPKVLGPKDDGKPRYSITIKDPKIIEGADTDLGQALVQKDTTNTVYKNKDGEELYSQSSRSKFPISIFTKETGSDSLPAPELLENELNPGQTVSIILSTYENKSWDSVGISMDGVIIASPENIDYFKSASEKDYSDLLGEKKNTLGKFRKEPKQSTDDTEEVAEVDNVDDTGIEDLFD